MKATAKHDCEVTLTMDLNSLSLNRMSVKKGQVIDLPVFSDEKLKHPKLIEILGERCVTFKDGMLMPTYSKDFDYSE